MVFFYQRKTKDSPGNHWDAAELSSNLSTPWTDMKTTLPSFQSTPSPLSHRVLWDASLRTSVLERIPFAQNNWIFITKREKVYDRHSATWQQMHLPDGGETWLSIQLNMHLPREWSPCSLTTAHSNSFPFLSLQSSGKNNQSFKWNSIDQKEWHTQMYRIPPAAWQERCSEMENGISVPCRHIRDLSLSCPSFSLTALAQEL